MFQPAQSDGIFFKVGTPTIQYFSTTLILHEINFPRSVRANFHNFRTVLIGQSVEK